MKVDKPLVQPFRVLECLGLQDLPPYLLHYQEVCTTFCTDLFTQLAIPVSVGPRATIVWR